MLINKVGTTFIIISGTNPVVLHQAAPVMHLCKTRHVCRERHCDHRLLCIITEYDIWQRQTKLNFRVNVVIIVLFLIKKLNVRPIFVFGNSSEFWREFCRRLCQTSVWHRRAVLGVWYARSYLLFILLWLRSSTRSERNFRLRSIFSSSGVRSSLKLPCRVSFTPALQCFPSFFWSILAITGAIAEDEHIK